MTSKNLPTKFAPAERASKEEIKRQNQIVSNFPLIGKLMDTVPDIFIILNRERQAICYNQALIDFLNHEGDRDALLGLRPGEMFHCIHAFESDGGCGTTEFCRECGAANAILTSQKGQKDIQECHITQKQNGKIEALDLRVFASPFQFDEEELTIFSATDTTHEKRRRALERIFFHDILNTAIGLRGFAEFLQEGIDEESEEFIPMIYNLSQRIIEEINAQKELTAAENNELSVTVTPFNSKELLQELTHSYENQEVAKDRYISIDIDAADFTLTSDPTLLRRVIGNMLKNALEASQPGETITLGCENIGNAIEFWVHNPNFMPRDVQLQMFQRSFSTKGAGRGLGTYSIKLLTERYLKGNIVFITSEKEGTTFKAWYPKNLTN